MTALLQGIGIGFAIAAPVGPIGLLCIRRTLRNGPAIGLASGLGAASADATYGLLVASGLSLTGWLLDHAFALSLVGALLLVWMGVGALRAFRARALAGDDFGAMEGPAASTRPGAFASTFALTLANPATILSFVGVIAALGAASAGTPQAALLLVLGVFLGSTLWWITLVLVVGHARRLVSPRSMRWVDLATGTVLVGTGVWVGVRALAS